MEKMSTNEMISALADGQLQGEDFAQAVQAVTGDGDGRATWHAYHLIGDALRSGELASASRDAAFLSRVRQGLAEPAPVAQPTVPTVMVTTRPAANDSDFRWKVVAGVASMAAVAAIAWSVGSGSGNSNGQPQMAQAPGNAPQQVSLAAGERQVMIRDERLDELLAAHRQFGGTPALQTPAGFLRNATFEGPAR